MEWCRFVIKDKDKLYIVTFTPADSTQVKAKLISGMGPRYCKSLFSFGQNSGLLPNHLICKYFEVYSKQCMNSTVKCTNFAFVLFFRPICFSLFGRKCRSKRGMMKFNTDQIYFEWADGEDFTKANYNKTFYILCMIFTFVNRTIHKFAEKKSKNKLQKLILQKIIWK